MTNGSLKPEDLSVECFAENLQKLGMPPTDQMAYNLYRGLIALAETQKETLQVQRKLLELLNRSL